MEIPVLIEPVAGNGYHARTGEPLRLSADGTTPEEALARLREMIAERRTGGTQLVSLEVATVPPWAPFAGMFKDDPLFDEWQEAVAEYREQRNRELDRL